MEQLPALKAETLARFLEYDPETGELTWRPTRTRAGGQPACLPSSDGGLKVHVAGHAFDAGQVAWALARGRIPSRVEYMNGDRSDTRVSNLKLAG